MTIRIQHREWDPICSEWDIWALGKIGRMILHLRPEEKPEDFWQPIFELGAPGHMWIDGFLSGFIPAGLEQAPASTLFMRLWRDMLEYALASEQWSHESEWWPPYLDQNWISVSGGPHWSDSQAAALRLNRQIIITPPSCPLSIPGHAQGCLAGFRDIPRSGCGRPGWSVPSRSCRSRSSSQLPSSVPFRLGNH